MNSITKQMLDNQLPVPTDDKIASLSALLEKQIYSEAVHRRYAPVKHILSLLGVAGAIGLSLIAPTAIVLVKPLLDEEKRKQRNFWKQYNPSYLRTSIKRLHKLKYVEIKEQNGEEVLLLTQSGKRRIFKYALDALSIQKPKKWDGRWRMIIYDVGNRRHRLRDVFRGSLKSLEFLMLQESVWLYPYPCEEEITFLREYYGIGNEVIYVVATKLEDDTPYREYFGLT